MTVLSFPNLKGFIEYLMENDIHRYGIVAYCNINMGEKGHGIYTERFRLSSINDNKKEILRCDIPYYKSVFVTEKHNSEEAKEPKGKVLKWINEEISKLTEGYNLKLLECEFTET